MGKYRVIAGSASECQEELNRLGKDHWIIFHGVSGDKDLTVIAVEVGMRI